MFSTGKFALFFVAVSSISTLAQAHDGHGFFASHWHATDAFGFIALGAMIVLAIWLSSKGK